jgi:hypothetical protein
MALIMMAVGRWPRAGAAAHTPHTHTPRGAKEKKKATYQWYLPTYLPFLRFFEIFRSDFQKYLYGVFGLPMQRNGQKRYKKKSMGKDGRKKVFFSQLFRPKSCLWCFWAPHAEKRPKTP